MDVWVAERASKTGRSIGAAHSPTPRPGHTSLRLPAGLRRRLARASARCALAPQAGPEPVAGNEVLCTERSIAPLASRRRQQPPVAHAPASLNVLRARRKRAVSGAGLKPRARTFRTRAPQTLAALGGRCVAHPCFGAGGMLGSDGVRMEFGCHPNTIRTGGCSYEVRMKLVRTKTVCCGLLRCVQNAQYSRSHIWMLLCLWRPCARCHRYFSHCLLCVCRMQTRD